MIFKHIIAITALLASASVNAANLSKQDTCANAPKYIHRIGADLRGGYVASSANHVAQDYDETGATKLHSAMSAHLKYSFKYSMSRAPVVYIPIPIRASDYPTPLSSTTRAQVLL